MEKKISIEELHNIIRNAVYNVGPSENAERVLPLMLEMSIRFYLLYFKNDKELLDEIFESIYEEVEENLNLKGILKKSSRNE